MLTDTLNTAKERLSGVSGEVLFWLWMAYWICYKPQLLPLPLSSFPRNKYRIWPDSCMDAHQVTTISAKWAAQNVLIWMEEKEERNSMKQSKLGRDTGTTSQQRVMKRQSQTVCCLGHFQPTWTQLWLLGHPAAPVVLFFLAWMWGRGFSSLLLKLCAQQLMLLSNRTSF